MNSGYPIEEINQEIADALEPVDLAEIENEVNRMFIYKEGPSVA